MGVKLLVIGKTTPDYLVQGILVYQKRLVHYADCQVEVIPDIKTSGGAITPANLKEKEAKAFLKRIGDRDRVVLLDEKGKHYTSPAFATLLEKWMQGPEKSIVFIIGGAFGFGAELEKRASAKLALSELTFSHQMVRLIFMEQLYRAFTILKGEPYHHK